MTNFVTYVLYGASDIMPLSESIVNDGGSNGHTPIWRTFDDDCGEE